MADKNLKVSENVPGKWYVDENCIACDSCISVAPDFFVMNDDSTHAYVKKQPATARTGAGRRNTLGPATKE